VSRPHSRHWFYAGLIYTIIKTASAVMQVVGGGRGWLAGDTDGLVGWPVCDAER